jgi:iron complex transport system permease protein
VASHDDAPALLESRQRAPRIASPHLIHGRGYTVLLIGLVVAVAATSITAISIGAVPVPLGTVWAVIRDEVLSRRGRQDPGDIQIVWQIRTPRVLLALVAGAGLSVAGAVLQAVVRNPLADPYILGAASGSSLGAVAIITLGSATIGGLGVSAAAFIGGVAALALVFVLGQRRGTFAPTRLVLAGVAVAYLASAMTSFLQLRADPNALRATLFWLLGSVASADWSDLGVPTFVVVTATVALTVQRRRLNALMIGDEAAASLGVNVNRLRVQLMIWASLLTASVIAVAGAIGFVGLVVPHVVRLLVGPDHRRVLPVSVLLGGIYLVLVDLAARLAARPGELPIGIFTTALGAPFFLWLMRHRERVAGVG